MITKEKVKIFVAVVGFIVAMYGIILAIKYTISLLPAH
jgi:hypothetical protein